MVVGVRDGVRRADVGAGKTGDAVIGMLDDTEALFRIQLENFGRTDVDAKLASAT